MATTIKDIAAQVGVSPSEVSRVLNARERKGKAISADLRGRILQVAHELGYRPHHVARSLVSGRTGTVGLIVYEVTNPFCASMVNYMERAAQAAGYYLILCNRRESPAMNDEVNLDLLMERWVDGILLWASRYPPQGYAVPLPRSAAPKKVVVLGYHAADGTDFVAVDRALGTYQVARHLIELGHARLGYLAPAAALSPQRPKLAGLLRALSEAGLPEPLLLPTAGESRSDGRIAAQQARTWRPQPTALLCYNDLIAIGAYRGLRDVGLSVPEEVALVGFDGIAEGEYLEVPLTTVEQPVAEMCETAMRFLVNRIAGCASQSQRVTLAPRLVVRQSSGAGEGVRRMH